MESDRFSTGLLIIGVKYILKRYELNHSNKEMIVGFDVTSPHGNNRYFETFVPLVEGQNVSENETCYAAYKILKPIIQQWVTDISLHKTTLIGREFIPPDEEN
jgi:hypothetical protein